MTTPLFDALADIAARAQAAPHVLVCLDVEEILPSAAEAHEPLQSHLRSFSFHPTVTLAIFSERNRAELQARVGVPGIIYAGNLGLEISGDGLLFVEPTAAANAGQLADLKNRLEGKLRDHAGSRVEDNGLALCVRVAQVDGTEAEEIRRLLHETLASANYPFHLDTRANTYQICPRVPWSKADAVQWIKEHVNSESFTIYIGSDDKDVEIIATVRDAITVKAGAGETLAAYQLGGPAEVVSFLDCLKNMTEPH